MAVFVVVGVVVLRAPAVVVAMVHRQCLPLLLWRRDSGDMTFSYAFVVKTPLSFFFLLLFPPLLLSVVWMVYFFVFRGAVGLLLMLIWRLTALA